MAALLAQVMFNPVAHSVWRPFIHSEWTEASWEEEEEGAAGPFEEAAASLGNNDAGQRFSNFLFRCDTRKYKNASKLMHCKTLELQESLGHLYVIKRST